MKVTKSHIILIFAWAVASVYLVGFEQQIVDLLPLVNVKLISAIALQVWFMSLFVKKRYYIYSILSIQILLSFVQAYQPTNSLVKVVMDGMDLGGMIGILMDIGVWA